MKIVCACGKPVIPESLALKGTIRIYTRRIGTEEWKLKSVTENLIMTASNLGRDLIVQWLLGNTTYPPGLNWGALGTGNTAPASNDTQLTAETNRAAVTSMQDGINVAKLQFFFPDAVLVNQTYYEAGSFVAGTSAPNSGQIFNHALLSVPYVKVSGEDTTLEIDISVA